MLMFPGEFQGFENYADGLKALHGERKHGLANDYSTIIRKCEGFD